MDVGSIVGWGLGFWLTRQLVLLPGDRLQIRTPQRADLWMDRTVTDAGILDLGPELGRLSVLGRAPSAVEETLISRTGLDWQVRVTDPRERGAWFFGVVNAPGWHRIPDGATLPDMIDAAGLCINGDRRRPGILGLSDAYQTIDLRERPVGIRPGDRIWIGTRRLGSPVYVIGGVAQPGPCEWEEGLSPAAAVRARGGLLQGVTPGGWIVEGSDGKLLPIPDPGSADSIVLGDGAVVFIPPVDAQDSVDILGEVANPCRLSFGKSLDLRDAVRLAGEMKRPTLSYQIEIWSRAGTVRRVTWTGGQGAKSGSSSDGGFALSAGDTAIVREGQVKARE